MTLVLAALAVILGGVMKGAIGAGVPIIAAPALTILFDVQTAVAILVVPNLLSNVWQGWVHRRQALPARFLAVFAGAAMAGVVVGSLLLAHLSKDILSIFVVVAIFAYIALRLAKPAWVLPLATAQRLALPVGVLSGFLQGTTGVSAPSSVTFLSAMRLPRETFIGSVSIFFCAMTAMQIPALWGLGLLTAQTVLMGFVALGLVLVSMPLGTWLGQRARPVVFDRLILVVLGVIGLKMLQDVLT